MTTRQFLISWAKLILITVSLIVGHIVVRDYAADSIATFVAPKFTPLTVVEEEQFQLRQKQLSIDNAIAGKEHCESIYGKEKVADLYNYSKCIQLQNINGWILHPKQIHKNEVIDPIANRVRDFYVPLVFGFLYVLIAIFMMSSLWKWVAKTVIPALQANLAVIKNRVDDETMLWTNRKMSTAVKQLDDLDNLFERGMITKEAFEERKAEIKKALAK